MVGGGREKKGEEKRKEKEQPRLAHFEEGHEIILQAKKVTSLDDRIQV